MWSRILLAAGLLAFALLVVYFFNSEGFSSRSAETPSYAPLIESPQYREDAQVASGGPNTPSVASPKLMKAKLMKAKLSQDPNAQDPYDDTLESANAPEDLRHPERSFGPGVIPDSSELAVQGGLASPDVGHSPQAFQQFSPEFANNGGTWLNNVTPAENDSPNYSSF